MKVWISSFDRRALPPPLKIVIGLVTVIGACSGKAISAWAMPWPTVLLPQTRFAAAVLRAVSCPGLQTGRPRGSTLTSLSMSTTDSRKADGWVPSEVAILPKISVFTGAYRWRGSVFGMLVPPNVRTRLPALILVLAAPAIAATPIASAALRASTTIAFLRISVPLSFAWSGPASGVTGRKP